MKKTSISIPDKLVHNWLKQRSKIINNLGFYVQKMHRKRPKRDILTQYNPRGSETKIISVYWSLEQHNLLRSVAESIRVSVSRLICMFLALNDSEAILRDLIPNYDFSIISWNAHCLKVCNTIRFRRKNRGKSPPLSP